MVRRMKTSASTSALDVTAADLRMRNAVQEELDWDSQFDAAEIGVSTRGGAVTLTGSIDTYAAKLAAERAAKRVHGVRAVANDIQVRLRHPHGDGAIAEDAVRELTRRPTLPTSVQVAVHDGHVTITGTVITLFQKAVAENAIRHIAGVKDVINRIQIAVGSPAGLAPRIAAAIERNGHLGGPHAGAHGLDATISGDTVLLTGVVGSWQARETAERVAMHAPGISRIENQLVVSEAEPDNVEADLC
jgi:osmotically-inducible protein OsmY